jgi:hypothetical protein
VAAAQFGVGGDGEVALLAGGGFPVGAVRHDGGEQGLALPVGIVQGLVAARQRVLSGGFLMVAVALSGVGLGAGAQVGQAGVPGGGADLTELITHPLRRPAVSMG